MLCLHDRPRSKCICVRQDFISVLIETGENVARRKSRSDNGEERLPTEESSRAEATTESEYEIFYPFHLIIIAIITVRIKHHRIWIYIRVVKHMPKDVLELCDEYNTITYQMLGMIQVPFGKK
jgi:hypothetical protein